MYYVTLCSSGTLTVVLVLYYTVQCKMVAEKQTPDILLPYI